MNEPEQSPPAARTMSAPTQTVAAAPETAAAEPKSDKSA